MSVAKRLVRKLNPASTAFFVCDIQEKFRSAIWQFPSVISIAQKMIKGAEILDIPVIVTEQALGHLLISSIQKGWGILPTSWTLVKQRW